MKKLSLAVGAIIAGLSLDAFAAITTNVSTVAELVGAIEYLNTKGSVANTIVLAKGTYDVSDCFMQYASGLEEARNSHLFIKNLTLKGETSNPRDTVICGGGEAKGHGVICGAFARVRDLTISNGWNVARAGGGYGGYYSDKAGGTLRETVSNCVVTCNYCDANWEGGAGIGSGVKVMDSEISFNRTGTSNCFGAVHGCDLYRCFVHSNSSGTRGGGLGACYAYDCIISNNTAATWGGGLGLNSGSYLLNHCTVIDNRSGSSGGGVYASGTGYITNSLITGNVSVGIGGGVCNATCVDSVISNNSVTANSQNTVYGGGVNNSKLIRCDVCYNYLPERANVSSGSSYGSGAYSSVLTDCKVFGNAIFLGGSNRQGAGMYGCHATNTVVYENYTVGSSSGVAMNSGSAYKCVFSNNQANVTWSGNQIRQPTGSIVECEFYNQSIECVTEVLVDRCRFWGYADSWCIPAGHNVASPNADLTGSSPVTPYMLTGRMHLRNCLFEHNAAGYFCLAYKKAVTTLENCTIADNRFSYMFYNFNGEGGESATTSAADIVNCLFTRNYNKDGSKRCDFKLNEGSTARLTTCLIGTAREGVTPVYETGTVTNDNARLNLASATHPYEPRSSSAARFGGTVLDWMTGAPDIRSDAVNYPRLCEGKVGIGCYQSYLQPLGMSILFR